MSQFPRNEDSFEEVIFLHWLYWRWDSSRWLRRCGSGSPAGAGQQAGTMRNEVSDHGPLTLRNATLTLYTLAAAALFDILPLLRSCVRLTAKLCAADGKKDESVVLVRPD